MKVKFAESKTFYQSEPGNGSVLQRGQAFFTEEPCDFLLHEKLLNDCYLDILLIYYEGLKGGG